MLRLLGKIVLGLGLALLAYFGVRALVYALVPPKTRVRWVVEEMLEGFNEARARPVLAGIAKDFVDETSQTRREDLHQVLAWMFLNETDDQGGFLWHAELVPESLAITVAEDEQSADVACSVNFAVRRGTESRAVWDAHFRGTVAETEDGWQWTRVVEANHRDRRR